VLGRGAACAGPSIAVGVDIHKGSRWRAARRVVSAPSATSDRRLDGALKAIGANPASERSGDTACRAANWFRPHLHHRPGRRFWVDHRRPCPSGGADRRALGPSSHRGPRTARTRASSYSERSPRSSQTSRPDLCPSRTTTTAASCGCRGATSCFIAIRIRNYDGRCARVVLDPVLFDRGSSVTSGWERSRRSWTAACGPSSPSRLRSERGSGSALPEIRMSCHPGVARCGRGAVPAARAANAFRGSVSSNRSSRRRSSPTATATSSDRVSAGRIIDVDTSSIGIIEFSANQAQEAATCARRCATSPSAGGRGVLDSLRSLSYEFGSVVGKYEHE
jgi:hypothetical protein